MRRLIPVAVLAALVLGVVELGAWAACALLAAHQVLYVPSGAEGWAEYQRDRDPLLGWPGPASFGKGEMDALGARIDPSFPETAPPCATTFGDSFTWGAEVSPGDAYPAALARRLGCRVANFGVPGYGTDQAFLRFRDRVDVRSRVVVLAHFSEDIIRNVNQVRDFIGGATRFGMKPRFVLGSEGELGLVPLPDLSQDDYAHLAERAPALLHHEYFLPGGPAGIQVMRWPHVLTAARAFGSYRIRARLQGRPSYEEFYDPDHPSGALPLTAAILEEFVRLAKERGQVPVVVLLPDSKDLQQLRDTGTLPYAPLAQQLARAGIGTPLVAEHLLGHLGGRDPCSIYSRCPSGHYTPEGYAQVAQVIGDWLAAHGRQRVAGDEAP